jgi:hypothetical protein
MSVSEHGGLAHNVTKNAHDVLLEQFPNISGFPFGATTGSNVAFHGSLASHHSAPSDSSSE